MGHAWAYSNPNSVSSRLTFKVRIEELNAIKEREADDLASKCGHNMEALRVWENDPPTKAELLKFGCSFPEGTEY